MLFLSRAISSRRYRERDRFFQFTIKSSHLTIAGIYTALAYYYANKESLDIEFARYQEECQQLELEYKAGHLS